MNRISELLKEQGRTNRYVASKIGVSEQTFSSWVQNKTQPNILQGQRIAEVLNVEMEELIKKEPPV